MKSNKVVGVLNTPLWRLWASSLKRKYCFTTPLPACGVLPPQGGQCKRHCTLSTSRARKTACGFTLIELLVVVLIIGILAAVAVPQYQKAVLKAKLHRGIPLVESLYQAQQAYRLATGDFASDLDDLDVDVHLDSSCEKTQNATVSIYACDAGSIGMYDNFSNMQYIVKGEQMSYLHYLKDFEANGLERKAGEVWCFAKTENKVARGVCESMGGTLGNSTPNSWTRYKIR